MPSPLDIAPSGDQPTITVASLGAAAAPTISGGTWYREKRTGAAETTSVGGSTAGLDLTGSTRFAYPGIPGAIAWATNTDDYVVTDYKPGGSTVNARWLFTPDFMTDADVVEFRLNAPSATPRIGLVFVNGLRVDDHALISPSVTAGSGYSLKLTFPSAATRRITIYGLNQTEGRFGGVAVGSGYSVWKPTAPTTRRIAFLGDSYTNGSGTPPTGASVVETFMWRMGLLMGGDEFIAAGIGTTGFIADVSGQPTSSFDGRVTDVLAMDPDVLVIAGGRNDSATGLQAAVEALIISLNSIPEIYVMPTASESTQSTVRAAMAAGAAAQGVLYLNVGIDAIAKGGDAIHPTWQGHQDLADAAFALLPVDGTLTASTPTVTVDVPTASWAGTATGPAFTGGLTADTPALTISTPVSVWAGATTGPGFTGTLDANTPQLDVAVSTVAWTGAVTPPLFTGTLTATTPTVAATVPTVSWSGTASVPTFSGTITTVTPTVAIAVPDQAWSGTSTVPAFTGVLTADTPTMTVDVPLATWAGTASAPGSFAGTLDASTPALTVDVPTTSWSGAYLAPSGANLTADVPPVTIATPTTAWAGTATVPVFAGQITATVPEVTVGAPATSWAGGGVLPVYAATLNALLPVVATLAPVVTWAESSGAVIFPEHRTLVGYAPTRTLTGHAPIRTLEGTIQ